MEPTPIVRLENVHFSYNADSPAPVKALDGVDLAIRPGEYVVILGHNGSGKSTLARHLNGLLLPSRGDVWVHGLNTKQADHLREIRATVGMVFQTPDNQIVATIVEEDVAFGPENLGVPHREIVSRVDWALDRVEMAEYRGRAPHLLSGGQKQRVCIAGVLAMHPQVLVLDEGTAMLDPLGRKEVLEIAARLNRDEGVTIVAITHFMEEAIHADRMVVMDRGRVVMDGPPRTIFARGDELRALHLDVPQTTRLAQTLHAHNPAFPVDLLTDAEFVAAYAELVGGAADGAPPPQTIAPAPDPRAHQQGEPVIRLRDVGHNYMNGTPLEVKAIEHVTMEVRRGEVLGIIGHTGSGKSTIVQHFNALLKPHAGAVTVFDMDTLRLGNRVREVRRRVGLVFQQPESQLFERYVGDDIAYGPRNLQLSRDEVRARVRTAMEAVGLGFEEFKDRTTVALSGGQKRRVALAGILALQPEILVLDEPTSGLDPAGRSQLLELILGLVDRGMTLVMISHNMEELARISDRIYVIADGATYTHGTVEEVFGRAEELQRLGLDVPQVTAVAHALVARGLLAPEQAGLYSVEDAARVLGERIRA